MGRRPNAIVGDFFLRGQKLEDASNRYEHTCKRCSEHFAKGRVDSMVNHLLKKCPGTTQEDRHQVFLQMQQPSSNKKRKNVDGSNTHEFVNISMSFEQQGFHPHQQQTQQDVPVGYRPEVQTEVLPGPSQAMQSSVPLSFLLQPQESALDTLAEVSRRHLDYHGGNQRFAPDEHQQPMFSREPERAMVEQALLVALQHQTSSQQGAPHEHSQNAMSFFETQEPSALVDNDAPPHNFAASPLVQAATAANHQLELSQQPQDQGNPIDPQLSRDHDNNMQPPAPSNDAETSANYPDYMTWIEGPQTFATQQKPPTDEPNAGFSTFQKGDKPNARARFSESRRQQVQDTRKRGACLRCRMLKKPCSNGTPCAACKKVDSARLWKGVCIRTRLADEFTMCSVSYFALQAKTEISTAAQGMVCQQGLPGRIEARSLGSTYVVTTGVMRHSTGDHFVSGVTQDNSPGDAPASEIFLIDPGVTDVPLRITEYCTASNAVATSISRETNDFIRGTLEQAQLLLAVESGRDEPPEFKKARPNYIAPSSLLKQIIELWVLTTLLASSKEMEHFELRLNLITPPTEGLQRMPPTSADHELTSSLLAPSSRRLVKFQLFGAIESSAHRLCKSVLIELERRLLQRKQVSTFATFISAVILLNVVERMTAFYESIDPRTTSTNDPDTLTRTYDGKDPQASTDSQSAEVDTPSTQLPLEQQSQTLPALWQQGPHFAKLLALLLRLRALPPKTTRTADNRLAILQKRSLPVRMNSAPVREHTDEEAEKAAYWLDPMDLDFDAVAVWQYGNSAGKGWRSWDGKFIGPLLVGAGVTVQ